MNNQNIRAIVQFEQEKLAIVFDSSLKEQEFLQLCLNEFDLDPENWLNFEVINIQHDCKIKTPKYLRSEDEMLILRHKKRIVVKSKDISRMESCNISKHYSDERLSLEILSSQEDIILSEIKYSKEDLEEEKVEKNELLLNDSIEIDKKLEGSLSSEEEEKEEEGIDKESDTSNEDIEVNLDEEFTKQEYADREELKNQVIIQWGIKNLMKLNFRTRERILVQEETKVSMILCSKKDKFGCPFYLEFKTDINTKQYRLSSFWNIHNHKLEKYESAKSIDQKVLEKIKELKPLSKSNNELTKVINKTFGKMFHPQTIYYQVNNDLLSSK